MHLIVYIVHYILYSTCRPRTLDISLQSNALHFAAFGGHLPCVKYLAAKLGDKKFDLSMEVESCLHKAVEGGSLRVVRYLIDKCGLDPKLQNRVRHTYMYRT